MLSQWLGSSSPSLKRLSWKRKFNLDNLPSLFLICSEGGVLCYGYFFSFLLPVASMLTDADSLGQKYAREVAKRPPPSLLPQNEPLLFAIPSALHRSRYVSASPRPNGARNLSARFALADRARSGNRWNSAAEIKRGRHSANRIWDRSEMGLRVV